MEAINASFPPPDGVACFNRMYLEVTQQIADRVRQDLFEDAAFVSRLDVVFANLYFEAVASLDDKSITVPSAWQPLLEARSQPGIEPIQFALAGMNAHINHDLPLAVVATCGELATAPGDGSHHRDYKKVNGLLDASEQSVRQDFETKGALIVDQHLASVATVVCNWSINTARDVAWDTANALWDVRDHQMATQLLTKSLGRTVAVMSRQLLVTI
jgi:hypothetical protein